MKSVHQISIEEMLEEVDRELGMRKHFYRKQVEGRKMSRARAHQQYTRLEAVKLLLDRLRIEKGSQTKLF
jgi:hypothetical protein